MSAYISDSRVLDVAKSHGESIPLFPVGINDDKSAIQVRADHVMKWFKTANKARAWYRRMLDDGECKGDSYVEHHVRIGTQCELYPDGLSRTAQPTLLLVHGKPQSKHGTPLFKGYVALVAVHSHTYDVVEP